VQYLTPILKWILPYVLKAADKYMPNLLEYLMNKITEKKENYMSTIQIIAKDSAEKPLVGVSLAYQIGAVTPTPAVTGTDGTVTLSGLTAGDSYTFTPTLTGYTGTAVTVTANDAQTEVVNIVMTADTVETAKSVITTAAVAAVTTTLTTENSALLQKGILWADTEITRLTAEENGDSKSWYVKDVRDPFEVIVLKTLVVLASAGDSSAISKLIAKIK